MITIRRTIYKLLRLIVYPISPFVIDVVFGGFFNFRNIKMGGVIKTIIYNSYMDRNHFYIGEGAIFQNKPILPHGLNGIHISTKSIIGSNVIIFHQVTIGSNTIQGHKKYGSPKIGNNVYIGAGAKIIGNVIIGENCRIGANAVVVKDMEPNTVAVSAPTRFIHSESVIHNNFDSI